jgi:thymidylate synthase (FAD)
MREEYYTPDLSVISKQSKDNRQGRETRPFDTDTAEFIRDEFCEISRRCYSVYKDLVEMDMSREIARGVLSLNYYTEFYWKIDLHNLLRFLRLRMAYDAQYEIRAYANEIAKIVKAWVPVIYEAFEDFSLNVVKLSKQEVMLLRRVCAARGVQPGDLESQELSARETKLLQETLL